MTSNFLVSSITTLISGFLFDRLGGVITFRLAAIFALAAIPIVLIFKEKKN
jgi:FSR family fosmidomycin resistance protein-like MFS transporter